MKVDYQEAANCLKMLAQPVRLAIVDYISLKSRTVGEIAEYCDIKSNLASEHLKLLRLCGFVIPTKSGRTVTYKLGEPHILKFLDCIHAKFGEKNGNKTRKITRKN